MSLRNTLYAYFLLEPSSLLVVVAQSEDTLANRTQKRYSALVWLDRRRVPGSYEQTICTVFAQFGFVCFLFFSCYESAMRLSQKTGFQKRTCKRLYEWLFAELVIVM